MKISLYSLKKILFQGEAQLLNCKTMSGEITILNNHADLITVLTSGVMKIIDQQKEYFFPIRSGFLEVRAGNEVRCIIEE